VGAAAGAASGAAAAVVLVAVRGEGGRTWIVRTAAPLTCWLAWAISFGDVQRSLVP
jgi:hypothetical protein